MITPRLSFILLILFIVSCKKELQPQDSSTSKDTAVSAAGSGSGPQITPPTANTPAVMPGSPAQSASPKPVAKGMNPPHGQPGHRCDIPVGASLSTPVKPKAATTQPAISLNKGSENSASPQASTTPALLQAPAQETAPGMNPPHGQPGHKCDIPVGQPLNPQ